MSQLLVGNRGQLIITTYVIVIIIIITIKTTEGLGLICTVDFTTLGSH